jgi:hypothetical protein
MEVAVAEHHVQGTPPFVDGFGERRVVLDARGDYLDVLRLNPSLSSVPAFEAALRERAGRISTFRHDAFSRVRSVETDRTSGTLMVISEHVRGARLSALLAAAEKRSVPIEMPAIASLTRQLVKATSAWRDQMPDVVHGAIGPDRIMITPDGRMVLVEHTLGAALEQLQYTRQRYWEELGVALPTTFKLVINARADVLQVGAVVLALVLGRRLKGSDRLDTIQPAIGLRVPPAFRTWLLKALQLDPLASFASVLDAREALDTALGDSNEAIEQDGLLLFMARCLTLDVNTPTKLAGDDAAAGETVPGSDDVPDVDLGTRIEALKAFLAHRSARRERGDQGPNTEEPVPLGPTPAQGAINPEETARPIPVAAPPATEPSAPRPSREPFLRTQDPPLQVDLPPLHSPGIPTPAEEPKRGDRKFSVTSLMPSDWSKRLWLATGAVLVLAIALAALVGSGIAPGTAVTGTFSITTSPAGIAVTIDGTPRGATPLTLALPAGDHIVELAAGSEQRRIPITIKEGSEVSQYLEMAGTAAAGGATELRVRTEPLGASVTVDGRFVGRSPVSVSDLSPGTHTVVLQHETGSATEQVLIEEGKTASLFVPLAPRTSGAAAAAGAAGWISVPAPVDVQIFENGRFLGSSRIDRIMLPAGRHDLEIVNESLGFQDRRSVRVTAGQVSAVNLAWPTGSLSINAVPWAEAFVDGRSVGETPIGNIQVPIGTHQITFRHPQLGERSTSVTVTTRAAARVGIDLRAK